MHTQQRYISSIFCCLLLFQYISFVCMKVGMDTLLMERKIHCNSSTTFHDLRERTFLRCSVVSEEHKSSKHACDLKKVKDEVKVRKHKSDSRVQMVKRVSYSNLPVHKNSCGWDCCGLGFF